MSHDRINTDALKIAAGFTTVYLSGVFAVAYAIKSRRVPPRTSTQTSNPFSPFEK